MNASAVSANEALEKLREGNRKYLDAKANPGDVSPEARAKTRAEGQFPYAVVVTCSDSRVIPEAIFSAGIGELFVIRVAGNVLDNCALGSVEYAVDHLGCKLVLVLGHECCGAVGAALEGGGHGYVKFITDEIRLAIGGEVDPDRASCLNARHSARAIEEKLRFRGDDVRVIAGLYRLGSGEVEFLER